MITICRFQYFLVPEAFSCNSPIIEGTCLSMKTIGIVTTWFERGAAYVSKMYYEALKNHFNVLIFARGGEKTGQGDPNWDLPHVTWGKRYGDGSFRIDKNQFFQWIKNNNIEAILFNEQREYGILADTKMAFPNVAIGAYVDYYTEDAIPLFDVYDFVVCNTKRHLEAMEGHKQAYYVRWGTDINLYKAADVRPIDKNDGMVTFFHSAGMSPRKGTDVLTKCFIEHGFYKKAKLVIHTQVSIDTITDYTQKELESYGITVIKKTVTAPGLYYMGDVYVYPTRLDGLGLTMYEALSSGLPVITTDYPPMSEVVDETCGRLVKVARHYCRADAYYWPMSICDEDDLASTMEFYADNPDVVRRQQACARRIALEKFDWSKNARELPAIFDQVKAYPINDRLYKAIKKRASKESLAMLPSRIVHGTALGRFARSLIRGNSQ